MPLICEKEVLQEILFEMITLEGARQMHNEGMLTLIKDCLLGHYVLHLQNFSADPMVDSQGTCCKRMTSLFFKILIAH